MAVDNHTVTRLAFRGLLLLKNVSAEWPLPALVRDWFYKLPAARAALQNISEPDAKVVNTWNDVTTDMATETVWMPFIDPAGSTPLVANLQEWRAPACNWLAVSVALLDLHALLKDVRPEDGKRPGFKLDATTAANAKTIIDQAKDDAKDFAALFSGLTADKFVWHSLEATPDGKSTTLFDALDALRKKDRVAQRGLGDLVPGWTAADQRLIRQLTLLQSQLDRATTAAAGVSPDAGKLALDQANLRLSLAEMAANLAEAKRVQAAKEEAAALAAKKTEQKTMDDIDKPVADAQKEVKTQEALETTLRTEAMNKASAVKPGDAKSEAEAKQAEKDLDDHVNGPLLKAKSDLAAARAARVAEEGKYQAALARWELEGRKESSASERVAAAIEAKAAAATAVAAAQKQIDALKALAATPGAPLSEQRIQEAGVAFRDHVLLMREVAKQTEKISVAPWGIKQPSGDDVIKSVLQIDASELPSHLIYRPAAARDSARKERFLEPTHDNIGRLFDHLVQDFFFAYTAPAQAAIF